MSHTAIHVNSLSKRYRVAGRAQYYTMRDRITSALTAPSRWFHSNGAEIPGVGPSHLWALRNVSFDLQEGEVLGLIGRNGAGKTTLLKILSRVTQPTEGSAKIRGRVGSLLEVGTGFHPELTGRENTYLNGAILGMGKKEIDRKFDDIVAFAEVTDFIDAPLKHYSTGMQMRLAFAVAAHFEPQILLVDEVLAVGDLSFQKKCLAKMGEVAHAGRTIVFVTHQMNQIRRLCEKVIWIDGGMIRQIGPTSEVVGAYESAVLSGVAIERDRDNVPLVKARFSRWEIVRPRTADLNLLDWTGPVTFRFTVKVKQPIPRATHGVALFDSERRLIWANGFRGIALDAGCHEFAHELSELPVKPGAYSWRVTLWDESNLVDSWDAVPDLIIGTLPMTHWLDEWAGVLNIPSRFTLSQLQEKDS
jgi:ABC-type polysaccharide/polyol phosphate transport system ATPase subunit